MRLICSETGIESNQIGRIELHSRFSYFEVDEKVAGKVLPKLRQGTYEGNTFNVTVSQDQSESGSYSVKNYGGRSKSGNSYHGKKKGTRKKSILRASPGNSPFPRRIP